MYRKQRSYIGCAFFIISIANLTADLAYEVIIILMDSFSSSYPKLTALHRKTCQGLF